MFLSLTFNIYIITTYFHPPITKHLFYVSIFFKKKIKKQYINVYILYYICMIM